MNQNHTENGLLEPLWSDGPVLPSSLHEVLESNEPANTEQTEEDISTLDESDYASSSDSETETDS